MPLSPKADAVADTGPSGKVLLHIFLLTYNREVSLRRTLEGIAAGALKDQLLTVMDNCSTDGTPCVCEEFRGILPRMEIVRHPRNIGFGANYLRSIELSRGEYTWVLADDDTLFPERMGELLDLLQRDRPEACFVGGPRQEEWPAGTGISPVEIQRRFHTFLTAQSFVPGLVFKSSLIGSVELVEAYFGIRTHFPQMIIGKKLFAANTPCAVLQPPVLRREDPAKKLTIYFDWVDGWSAFCRSLPPGLRRDAFYSYFTPPNMAGMLRQVLHLTVWAKIDGVKNPEYHMARIGLNAGLPVRMALIVCRLAGLVPGSVYRFARECYRKVKYGWLGRPLPANYHKPVVQDELQR